MENEFELIYYCQLGCDFAYDVFFSRYRQYLGGMITKLGLDYSRHNQLFEYCDSRLYEILISFNSFKENSFKTFFVSCVRHHISRYSKNLTKKSRENSATVQLHQDIIYNGRIVSDDCDPQYYDAINHLSNTLGNFYNQLNYDDKQVYNALINNQIIYTKETYPQYHYKVKKLRGAIEKELKLQGYDYLSKQTI